MVGLNSPRRSALGALVGAYYINTFDCFRSGAENYCARIPEELSVRGHTGIRDFSARRVLMLRLISMRASAMLLVAATTIAADKPPAPEDVQLMVRTRGAPAAVRAIGSSRNDIKRFFDGVGSGDPRWINAARAVAPAVDAGASEELNDALAKALVAKPYQALPWLKAYWWQGDGSSVCVFAPDSELPHGYLLKLRSVLAAKPRRPFRNCAANVFVDWSGVCNHRINDDRMGRCLSAHSPKQNRSP